MNICVYGASSSTIDKIYIQEVERLGEVIAERGHGVVFGGGASGCMGAAARGARRRGGAVLGVAPTFFNVDGVLFPDCTDFISTETMRERKYYLEEKSDGFVISPGGIGTFDEFFEILTLKQLGRHNKPIVIFNVNGYYDSILRMMEESIEKDFVQEGVRELYTVLDDAEQVVRYIEEYDQPQRPVSFYKKV